MIGSRSIDHVLRIGQVEQRLDDGRTIDDLQPVIADTMVVANDVELNGREHALEGLAVEPEVAPSAGVAKVAHRHTTPFAADAAFVFAGTVIDGAVPWNDLGFWSLGCPHLQGDVRTLSHLYDICLKGQH